jgi:hypothetical protein
MLCVDVCRKLGNAVKACQPPFQRSPSCFHSPDTGVGWSLTSDACARAHADAYRLLESTVVQAAETTQLQASQCESAKTQVGVRVLDHAAAQKIVVGVMEMHASRMLCMG